MLVFCVHKFCHRRVEIFDIFITSLEHLSKFHYIMTKLTIHYGIKAIGRIHNHDYEKAKTPSFDI
jgi:hypothetical protein